MEVLLGKIVEDIYDFHQPSMMFHKTTFSRETGFKYFLPEGNLRLRLCNLKHEIDQNPV